MIAGGALKAGDRLPANRELAKTLGVNRNTVTTAYAELAAEGLITSRVGSGTYISQMPAPASRVREEATPSPMSWESLLSVQSRDNWLQEMSSFDVRREVISLALALPSADLFPLDDFRRCVDLVLRKQGRVLLQLGTTSGYAPLQEYIAAQLALSGVRVSPDEVLITNGCQQSLDLIRQILVGPGEEVALENPTYPGALSVFCGTSSRFFSVPVGPNGIDLNVLEDVLFQLRAALRKNVLEYVQVNSVWADRNAEVSRTRTAKHAECAGIGRILESDFLSWPDQYLTNQIQRLLAAVCYEHLIGRNAHSRERKLSGDIFLKRRISAGCSKLEQDSPLFSKHQIDAAAEIIQRKKVGRRQSERE